jgi:hypothetical protein
MNRHLLRVARRGGLRLSLAGRRDAEKPAGRPRASFLIGHERLLYRKPRPVGCLGGPPESAVAFKADGRTGTGDPPPTAIQRLTPIHFIRPKKRPDG